MEVIAEITRLLERDKKILVDDACLQRTEADANGRWSGTFTLVDPVDPSTHTITASVTFEDDTIVLSAANRAQPLVRTSGRVVLPETGTIVAAPGYGFLGGDRFMIAECGSYSGPADTKGWTFVPADDGRKGKFVFSDGVLWLEMSKGLILIVQ